MNPSSTADPNSSSHQGFFVNFNQDSSSIAVGTQNGYKLFSLGSADALDLICENGQDSVSLVERFFSSSLIVVVALPAPRKLRVLDFRKGTEICSFSFSNTILAIKLNRKRLVVCLEESLYIHSIKDMGVLHTIRETPANPLGLCSLSVNSDNSYLAYPGSSCIGEVQIFDSINLHAKTMIPAHNSPLAALAFSPTGTRIATASEKGTVIRVFSVNDGAKLYEFRRGVKRCVVISSLAFSTCSQFLCCSSNTETVHVFKLEEPKEVDSGEEQGGWRSYFSKAVSMSANYLPTQVTEVFNQGRAFAVAHLPFQGVRNIVTITSVQNQLRLLVATADGYLYVYNMNPEGGDLSLYKQHRLDGRSEGGENTPKKTATTVTHPKGGSTISSYAGVTKGTPIGQMSESEKLYEIAAAVELPPEGGFRFDDENEFPPITHKLD